MSDAVLFDEPISFQPTKGCQRFMAVDPEFWNHVLGTESEPSPTPDVGVLTLGADEAEQILLGEQRYLLRSQRLQTKQGKIYLAVKSLDFTVPGAVEFESAIEFTSLQQFKKWEGLDDCNPNDTINGCNTMKRLQDGKPVFAIRLEKVEKFSECLQWRSPVSGSRFKVASFGCTYICTFIRL